MGLFSKREKEPKAPKGQKSPEAKGSSWTHGRQMSGRLLSGLLFAAIACGPIALFAAAARPAAIASAPAQTQEAGLSVQQQSAGGYALGYVGSWLGASKEAPGDLGDYIDLATLRQLSEQPWEYRNLAVVSITPVDETSFINVVVAGNVKELTVSDSSDTSSTTWPRRYFQVAVSAEGDALRVVGLPAPVAAPVEGKTTSLAYAQTISSSDPAAETVSAFLGAYLAGSGELARFSSPGTDFTALSPAPYVNVSVFDLRADVAPAKTPGDGDVVKVLAAVSLLSPLEQQLTSTYSLTLTARAGRWEVSAIDLAPQATSEKKSATPAPSPSGTGN